MTTFALTLINEQGKKYTFTSNKFKPGTSLASIAGFSNGLAEIGVSAPNGSTWVGSLEPKEVQPQEPKPPTDAPKKEPKKKKDESKEAKTEDPKSKKEPNSSWILSPSQVINWKPETVIRKLNDAFDAGAKASDFVSTLRMVKYVWHSGLFDFDRRVDPRDFRFMLQKAYDFGQKWTKQMMEALPDLLYLFAKDYQSRIHRQWQSRRQAEKKEMKELQEKETIETTEPSGEKTVLGAETINLIVEAQEKPKNKGRKLSKKDRKWLKTERAKGKKQPKKPDWIF